MNRRRLDRERPFRRAASATGTAAATGVARSVEHHRRRGRPAQALPLAAGALQSGLRALDEPRPLLLRDPSEDGDEERPDRAARVEPALAHREHRDPEPVEFEHGLDSADHAAVEAVERPDPHGMDAARAHVGRNRSWIAPVAPLTRISSLPR